MSLKVTRFFTYSTLLAYLIVGSAAVRFCMPESVTFQFTSAYLNLVSDAPIEVAQVELLNEPEITFAEIKIPVPQPVVLKKIAKIKIAPKTVEVEAKILAANELPFHEAVILTKIEMKEELPTNLLALYQDFTFNEAVAKTEVADEVSTSQASTETVEPEFFEYPNEVKTIEKAPVKEIAQGETSTEIETPEASDLAASEEVTEPDSSSAVAEVAESQEPEFFDYPEKLTTQSDTSYAKPEVAAQAAANMNSGLSIDYPRVNKDIASKVMPTVSQVNSQSRSSKPSASSNYTAPAEENLLPEESIDTNKTKIPPTTESYPLSLSIAAMGSDLKTYSAVQGFEVRFQDDLSETLEDFGAGEVKYEALLSQPKMTRAVTLLKRGYIPTSTEVILEEGSSAVSIPLIEEETFNEIQQAHEGKGMVGALLVELDDESELAKIDVPFGDVIKLNGDFKKTDAEDFRYQLFVGVHAGNAIVSYHRSNKEIVSKIVHIHENELTYDANFYEDVVNEKVRLYEEDLLAKESSPLIISGEQVKVFATHAQSKKINNHTYKMNFGASDLGGRRYLELNHQSEPVFVGIRDNNHVTVPSENFMRHILSKVEGSKLGNRCLVQINLSKKAEKFDVASESVASSLMTSTQVLDNDGKFYDTLSEKTQKIMVIGEAQGAEEISPEAKINVKIQYLDGTIQFLNSYCSPNTYLVEQL